MLVTIPLPSGTFTARQEALIVEPGTASPAARASGRPSPGEEADVWTLHRVPRLGLDERDLKRMTNRELDDAFRASPPAELPAGVARGTALVFNGTLLCRVIARLVYWFGWQGKRVDPSRDGLVNRITPLRLPLIRGALYQGDSWVDDRPCTVIDYSTTSRVARMVRDETRLVGPDLHLGVVWLWRRRAAWFTLRAPRQ